LSQSLPLDHVVTEYNHRTSHFSDFIARMSGGYARGGISVGEALHDRGQTVERLRDAAPDQPTEAEAKRNHRNTDCDNAGSCSRLGHGEAFGRFACSASGVSDDFVCSGKHILIVDINDRTQRPHAVISFDPFLESVRIGFHLLFERSLE
jgi:hypothetical protein